MDTPLYVPHAVVATTPSTTATTTTTWSDRSVHSESAESTGSSTQSQRGHSNRNSNNDTTHSRSNDRKKLSSSSGAPFSVKSQTHHSMKRAPPTARILPPGNTTPERSIIVEPEEDDLSSLGSGGVGGGGGTGDDASISAWQIQRILSSIRKGEGRPYPSTISPQEQLLWDMLQQAVDHGRAEHSESTEASLRSLQHVLAERTSERDRAMAELQSNRDRLESALEVSNHQREELERKLQATMEKCETIDSLRDEKTALLADVKTKELQIHELEQQRDVSTDVAKLQQELKEKTVALESAKMIITSLEHASGKQSVELRQKLKTKDEEVQKLQKEALERQASLDTLAQELRELRRMQAQRQRVLADDRQQRLMLSKRLEKNVSEIRESAVVLEVTQDPLAVGKVLDYVCDSIVSLKEGIHHLQIDSEELVEAYSSRDNVRVKKELEDKIIRIRSLEEELKNLQADNMRLRAESDDAQKCHELALENLRTEVRNLQTQYSTNITILARKERELAVLRDSLIDDGVGYISDDAEDDDDDSPPLSTTLDTSVYGPSQVEALATLLAQGGGMEASNDVLRGNLVKATAELERTQKQLKVERESLANAKMIISSLEKANKSMMEDLRSRLQESNAAIASLLEKSVGNEKITAQLRNEFETLKRLKDEEKEKHQSEIDRLRSSMLGVGWNRLAITDGSGDDRTDLGMITETID